MLTIITKLLKHDLEPNIMTPHNVLDLELGHAHVFNPDFRNILSVLAGGRLRLLLRFGTGAHHLTRSENQSCCFGIADSHDCRGKSFWFILDVLTVVGYCFQI